MTTGFEQVQLYTDSDGRARFRTQIIGWTEGTPQTRLTSLHPSDGYQLRQSPPGFASEFHCTTHPQWVFILTGTMEIALQDGSARQFSAGEHFHSADTLPPGASFNPALHGHRSRQVGSAPLTTLFVREG